MPSSGPSLFTYTLTRQYPFQWVTWAVLTGGIVLATLFSFMAVANNAYAFQSIYTTDPNATVSHHAWFQKAPFSWISDMGATCQPALLTTGTTYYTTNRGFAYTLTGMRSLGDEARMLSAVGYRNTTLESCEVAHITLDILRRDNTRYPAGDFWTWGATTASASTTCMVFTESGLLQVELTTILPTVANYAQLYTSFLAQNTSSNVNSYYGFKIAPHFYAQISTAMGYSVPGQIDGTSSWGAGLVNMSRNYNVTDYTDADFFVCDAGFTTDTGLTKFMRPPHTIRDWDTGGFHMPNISITIDAFGKTLYSLLLLDVGVNDTSNALLSQRGVEFLQSINDTDLAAASGKDIGKIDIAPPFDSKIDPPIENVTVSARLSSQYLCSVPKQKSGLSIFVAVVLAELVFLNACWTLFGWVMGYWLGRKDPRMMHCEGCLTRVPGEVEGARPRSQGAEDEEILLQPRRVARDVL